MASQVTRGQQADSILLGWEATMVVSEDSQERLNAFDSLTNWIIDRIEKPKGWTVGFKALRSLAVQYPADSSFRLMTLQVARAADSYHHFGLLQFRDVDTIICLEDTELGDYSTYYEGVRPWKGALYYEMREIEVSDQMRQFLLFGFDSHRGYFHRKVAEIMAVDPASGHAHFVEDGFHYAENETKSQIDLVYAAEVPIRLHYNDSLEMIVHDHLIPMPSVYEKGRTIMVSDGSYEGYKWAGGHWQHVPKVFHQVNDGPPGQGLPAERKRLFDKK